MSNKFNYGTRNKSGSIFSSWANKISSMTWAEKTFWIFGVFIGIGVIVTLYKDSQTWYAGTEVEKRFSSIIHKYKSYNKLKKLPANRAYIRGHALVIDQDGNILPFYYDSLSSHLLKKGIASEAVGTIVIIEAQQRIIAYYTSDYEVKQSGYLFTIIDITIPAVIEQKSFWGSKPATPKTKSRVSFWTGTNPTWTEVSTYLESLPVRRIIKESSQSP